MVYLCLSFSLEMLDKSEAPSVPDGYGISVAYACLLDIVNSISVSMKKENEESEEVKTTDVSGLEKNLQTQLVVSSWCGLLAALTPLVDCRYSRHAEKIKENKRSFLQFYLTFIFIYSTDEATTENILQAIQLFASFCGRLGLDSPRDSFIIAICKASLPPQYALSVLNVPLCNFNSAPGL